MIMTGKVLDISDRFKKLQSRVNFIIDDLDAKEVAIGNLNDEIDCLTKQRWVLTEAQGLTQTRFKKKVESLINLAMKSCYQDRIFDIELIFETKRNQMEVRPIIFETIEGNREPYEDPEDDINGGLVDVISFSAKIALWSLEKPQSRPIIILDEPMKNMGALISLGGKMLSEIAHDLGFQLIIVTHEDELISIADRAYEIKRINNISQAILRKERREAA